MLYVYKIYYVINSKFLEDFRALKLEDVTVFSTLMRIPLYVTTEKKTINLREKTIVLKLHMFRQSEIVALCINFHLILAIKIIL